MKRRTFLSSLGGTAFGLAPLTSCASLEAVHDEKTTSRKNPAFGEETHDADFCVVGGGMAGLCAGLAAARHGAKVVLMHDRPMLGGNASSECRMHICGADRHRLPHLRETGILEDSVWKMSIATHTTITRCGT